MATKEQILAVHARLLAAAETEVAAIGDQPRCVPAIMVGVLVHVFEKHGATPQVVALLLDLAFACCGARGDGAAMVDRLLAARRAALATAAPAARPN